ncbi:MAG TPA: ester cyclase [Herpetosiphonaceae bacterium]
MTAHEKSLPENSVSQELFKAWNARDYDRIQALITEDVAWHNTPTDTRGQGRETYRQMVQAWHNAMPDNQVEIRNLIVTDEWEVVEAVGHATHSGPLAGPIGRGPASGRSVDIHFCMINHIRDGKIDRCSGYLDMTSLMGGRE